MGVKLFNLTRSFLFRILISNVLLISLIIFILSTILYFSFRSIGIKMVTESILDRLYQTSYSTSYLQDASLGVIAQVYMDNDITDVLSMKDLDGPTLYELKRKLQRIVDASNFVDSISIYNGTGNHFFSTKDYSPESEKEYLFKYVNDKKRNDELGSGLHPIPRLVTGTLSLNNAGQVHVYSYIMYNNYKGDARPEKGIILNVKEDWMHKVIQSAGANYLGSVFILNQDGIVMSHTREEMFLKDLSGEDYVKRVFHSGNTGYFTANIDHVPSLVTYVSSDKLEWKFISVLPFSTVVADIDRIRNNIFLFGIFIFFLGTTLSYFFARKVSFPIFTLKQKVLELESSGNTAAGDIEIITTGVNEAAAKLRTLESMKREMAALEKETFIRNLLLDSQDGKNRGTDVKGSLSIRLEHSILVVIFKIDNFHELQTSKEIDLNLLKFAINNIACEILSAQYTVEAADTGEVQVALLINTLTGTQMTEEEALQPYLLEIQKAVLKYFKFSITAAIGPISENAAGLNTSYKATVKNFEYRLILGHQSIIPYSYVLSMHEKEYVFPESMEKNMLDALKLCKKEQAQQLLYEIANQAMSLGINALHSAIIRLAIAVSNTAQTAKLYYDSENLANMDVNTLVGKLNQMETMTQITAFFEECFQRIIDVLDEKRSTKNATLINNVKKYIESNYMDPNLSLKSIADLYHISTAYLGKLFKESVGDSVSEYINEIRLKEALKLLAETSISINDIIEKTGNSSTLFFRCFKKALGITPNEYRKKMQRI